MTREDATFRVRRCHQLRKTPLAEFATEDLRIMIAQAIGATTLVPMALPTLTRDPLAEGDFYPGDLLAVVLRLDEGYWEAHPEQAAAAVEIAERVDVDDEDTLVGTDLPQLISSFLRQH